MDKIVDDIPPCPVRIQRKKDAGKLSQAKKNTVVLHRHNIKNHPEYDEAVFELKEYLQSLHQNYDLVADGKQTNVNEQPSISSQAINKSSQLSVLLQPQQNIQKNQGNSTYFFKCLPIKGKIYNHNVYIDQQYENCVVIPMQQILNLNDHPVLYSKCLESFQDKDEDFDPMNKKSKIKKHYKIELVNVFNIHEEKNSDIRQIVFNFFTTELANIESTIAKTLSSKSTRVLLIIDRDSVKSNNGEIDNKNLFGAIMFGGHSKHGFIIDYLAVNKLERYYGLGTHLLHLSQLYSLIIIKDQCGKMFKNRMCTTYLTCRKDEVGDYYDTLGFEQIENLKPFESNNELSELGDRVDYNDWKSSDDPLEILTFHSTQNLVPRYINRVTPGSHLIEDSLYNSEEETDNTGQLYEFPRQVDRYFKKSIGAFLNELMYTPVRQGDIDFMTQTNMSPETFHEFGIKRLHGIPFGELHENGLTEYFKHFDVDDRDSPETTISQLFTKFLLPCRLMFYPPAAMGLTGTWNHASPCWICLECKYCKKRCMIKKDNLIDPKDYLLKVIFSTWSTHVFGYQPPREADEWNLANKDWHVCDKRTNDWFENLKLAQNSDVVFFYQQNRTDGYHYAKSSVSIFISILIEEFEMILKGITMYLVDLKIACLDHNMASPPSTPQQKDLLEAQKFIKARMIQLQEEKARAKKEAQKNKDQIPKKSQHELKSEVNEEFNDDDSFNSETPISKLKYRLEKLKKKKENKNDLSFDDDTPLSQLKKHQNSSYAEKDIDEEDEVKNMDEGRTLKKNVSKRRKLREAISKGVKEDKEDISNRLVKDPDINRQAILPKIKENSPLDDTRSKADKKWNELVAKDYITQQKATGIEYVKVKDCQKLRTVSKKYIEQFKAMSRNEKINLLEIEDYDSDVDKSKLSNADHFLLHMDGAQPVVIHKNWFEIDQDDLKNTDTRRIKVSKEKKCYEQPNTIHKLASDEKRAIKKACNIMTEKSQIQIIKRLPDDRRNVQYFETKFEKSTIRSSVKYIGIDMNNISCPLEDQWLKDNFNNDKCQKFWNDLLNLKPNQTIEVPIGSSDVNILEIDIPSKDKGPPLNYIQIDGSDCLVYSLASAMNLVGVDFIAQRLVQVAKEMSQNNQMCKMNNILDIMTNKVRKRGERRTRLMVSKMKPNSTYSILHDRNSNSIYHCVLYNHHSVVIYNKWIIDPMFPFCIRRKEKYLRMSAELEPDEDTEISISIAYKYQKILKK